MAACVSVLIVSFNTRALLLEAIESILAHAGPIQTEILVWDNASSDGSPDAVDNAFQGRNVRVLRSERNLGFAAGVNGAAGQAQGDALLIFNSDARLSLGALEALCDRLASDPRAAMVAPRLVYADGSPQPAAFAFPGLLQVVLDLFPINRLMNTRLNGRMALRGTTAEQIDHPLGACMLIPSAAWRDVGALDEGYFMYLEEVDWCRRARGRGWQIWHEPAATVVHHSGQSTRQASDAMFAQLWRSRLRYYERFEGPLFNRVVRLFVRLGLRRALRGAAPGRRAAITSVLDLVSR